LRRRDAEVAAGTAELFEVLLAERSAVAGPVSS
jgi:hypothetical protein